jgi:hypothetical protein
MGFEFRDSIKDFFCSIRSRLVDRDAFIRKFRSGPDEIYFRVICNLSKVDSLFINVNSLVHYNDDDEIKNFSIPFKIVAAESSCGFTPYSSCFYRDLDLKLSPEYPREFSFPLSRKKFLLGYDRANNNAEVYGSLDWFEAYITPSRLILKFYGAVAGSVCGDFPDNCPFQDFVVWCEPNVETAFIEYSREFFDYILLRFDHYGYVSLNNGLTFSM